MYSGNAFNNESVRLHYPVGHWSQLGFNSLELNYLYCLTQEYCLLFISSETVNELMKGNVFFVFAVFLRQGDKEMFFLYLLFF